MQRLKRMAPSPIGRRSAAASSSPRLGVIWRQSKASARTWIMPEPVHFLFVSHVSEDRLAAMAIVGELESRGIPCWIAPRNIHPGRPFDDEIVEAIEKSRAILLIFSDLCNESEYIRRE